MKSWLEKYIQFNDGESNVNWEKLQRNKKSRPLEYELVMTFLRQNGTLCFDNQGLPALASDGKRDVSPVVDVYSWEMAKQNYVKTGNVRYHFLKKKDLIKYLGTI